MGKKLTTKETAFVRRYMEIGNAAKAYRETYEVSPDALPQTSWSEGYRILGRPHVSAMVGKLQLEAAERTLVTVESITAEYNENRLAAAELDQPAAMNTATTGKAKLHGLLIDKQETEVTGNITFTTIYEKKPND